MSKNNFCPIDGKNLCDDWNYLSDDGNYISLAGERKGANRMAFYKDGCLIEASWKQGDGRVVFKAFSAAKSALDAVLEKIARQLDGDLDECESGVHCRWKFLWCGDECSTIEVLFLYSN